MAARVCIARRVFRSTSVTGTAWRTLGCLCVFPTRVEWHHSLGAMFLRSYQGDLIVGTC